LPFSVTFSLSRVTVFSSLHLPRHPTSTLFPYTTLFRSLHLFVVVNGHMEYITWDSSVRILSDGTEVPFETNTYSNTSDAKGTSVDRKSTRLNSSHVSISYAVFCLKKKKTEKDRDTNNNV